MHWFDTLTVVVENIAAALMLMLGHETASLFPLLLGILYMLTVIAEHLGEISRAK